MTKFDVKGDMENEQHRQKQEQLEDLYERHRDQIRRLASDDPSLLIDDIHNVVTLLKSTLATYEGQLDDASFLNWATEIIKHTVARLAFFYALRKQCRKSILGGIWSIVGNNLDLRDHSRIGFILSEIEGDTWAWVWKHIDDLMVLGTAAPSTRLFAQGKFHALTWRKRRLRENARFDYDVDVAGFGIQPYLDADESPLFFDPNHDNEAENDQPTPRPMKCHVQAPSDSFFAMKSGVPRLLCRSCAILQAISPDPASEPHEVKLSCGHQRPASLPKNAYTPSGP